MTVQRRMDFPIHALAPLLEKAGWDVSVDETLIAVRAEADGFFQLKADRGGRVYLQRAFISTPPRGRTVTKAGRDYAFHEEITVKREVATQLEQMDDFLQVLATMRELVLKPDALVD